jgi:hypothetical protein
MTDERRRFFRIDEEVKLSIKLIESAEIDNRKEDFWENNHAFSIRNQYNFEIEQHLSDFNKIEKKMPELARYLSVLGKQIDRITDSLTAKDIESSLTLKNTNISAQGISFYTDEEFAEGSMLELNIMLLPTDFKLIIISVVVKLEKNCNDEQGCHKLSLEFEQIHEADREILIKHIHAAQMKSLTYANQQEG